MWDPRDLTVPQAALVGLGIVVVVTVVFAAATSAAAFGAYNYGWDGTASLRGVADETAGDSAVLQNTSVYDRLAANGTLVVVVGPDESYDSGEVSRIERYVRRGGTLVVAGDFGAAAPDLLSELNASVSIDGGLVRDERNYGRSPAFPEARVSENETFGDAVETVALNYPSALTGTDSPNVSVLVQTSEYAYIDTNRNDELDEDESLQSYPVVAREPVGNGSVISISDPSVFINSMLDRGDNREFTRGLFEPADRVRFDYTHSGGIPPLVRFLLFVRSSSVVRLTFGLTVLGIVIGGFRYGPTAVTRFRRRYRHGEGGAALDEETIAEIIARTHPDWDRDRVRRLAEQLAARRSAPGDD